MTMFASQWLANPSTEFTIDQSIRFNDNDSAYLARTPASDGNRQTMTFSWWMKRGNLDITDCRIFTARDSNDDQINFRDASDYNRLDMYLDGSGGARLTTAQVFNDVSAWYHCVVAIDTTQSTASDRIKIYVNGVRVTDFDTETYPSLNKNLNGFNNNAAHAIGARAWSTPAGFYDGYLAEICFIDGQQLDASSFGETNSDTNQWVPIDVSGLTFGANGYHLKGQDSSDLGNDSSGNGNDFTSSGLAAADQVTDSPTNNTATLNPLNPVSSCTFSDGNLQFAETGGSNSQHAKSTIGFTSGEKKVAEMEIVSGSSITFGICDEAFDAASNSFTGDSRGYVDNGKKSNGSGTQTTYGATYTTGDVIRIEVDLSSNPGTIEFFKDGVSQGDAFTDIDSTKTWFFWCRCKSDTIKANFGQLGFAGTPTTGFTAPTVANLDDSTIADGSEYYHPQLYTGTGVSGLSVTNDASAGDFKPDILWLAPRSNGDNKVFFDSVRGTTQRVKSNSSDAEDTDGTAQLTFEADGFDLDTTDVNFNGSGRTYVAWQWHTTGGTTSSNTDGDITSTVSANTTSGVAVLTYSGNGSDNQEIGHGLGIAPKMIITKRRDSTGNWTTYHDAVGINKAFYLNLTNAPSSNTEQYRAVPTSSVYTVGVGGDINNSSGTYVAMVFAEVEGFSKFGSYEGNGSSNGPFVYTGFKPRWVLFRRYDATEGWTILDTARGSGNFGSDAGSGGTNPTAGNDLNAKINANDGGAEEDNSTGSRRVSFLSNGFKLRTTNTAMNASGDYLYMAFAECPFKVATAR